MRISKNFTLSEMTHSDTAQSMGITNTPNSEQIDNLVKLCVITLQPLRDLYGKAMGVNSGYRCPELNKAVGGVPTSDHLKGSAADIRVSTPRDLLAMLVSSNIPFRQAIIYPTFLHISYRSGDDKRQVLYAKGVKP